jgi:hypothetical protein
MEINRVDGFEHFGCSIQMEDANFAVYAAWDINEPVDTADETIGDFECFGRGAVAGARWGAVSDVAAPKYGIEFFSLQIMS